MGVGPLEAGLHVPEEVRHLHRFRECGPGEGENITCELPPPSCHYLGPELHDAHALLLLAKGAAAAAQARAKVRAGLTDGLEEVEHAEGERRGGRRQLPLQREGEAALRLLLLLLMIVVVGG